jgi:hypothetical protein
MPVEGATFDPSKYASEDVGGVGMPSNAKIEVAVRINHEGEVNKVRKRLRLNRILTRLCSGAVHAAGPALHRHQNGGLRGVCV